jgi:hypothetical protein
MERVDALAQEVRQLREQMAPTGGPSLNERVDALVREMHRRVEWWRATVAVGLIIVIAISGAAFLLELRTRSEIADANRKLCPLVALMIPDTGGREPTTEYGRQLVDQARLLYAAYGCPPKGSSNG